MNSVCGPGIIAQLAAIILWGAVFLFLWGLVLTRFMVKVLNVSLRILMPIIAVLCVIGVYAYNNNTFHLKLLYVFGVVGYFMDKMGYAPAPLILGLILGNLADAFFRRALLLSDGSMLGLINRPIAFFFFLACIVTILNQLGLVRYVKNRYFRGEKT